MTIRVVRLGNGRARLFCETPAFGNVELDGAEPDVELARAEIAARRSAEPEKSERRIALEVVGEPKAALVADVQPPARPFAAATVGALLAALAVSGAAYYAAATGDDAAPPGQPEGAYSP